MPSYRSSDGLSLYYEEAGSGLPVIALAGLTRNGADFNHVAPHLAGVRLIRPDYRGRGRSEYADPATYTIPTEAGDVLALMDHLGLERAAILGTSRGGLIAMGLATAVKDRLLGVALNDIGPALKPEGLGFIEGYIGRRPTQRTYDEVAVARAAFMKTFRNVPPERWRAEVEQFYIETPDGLDLRYDKRLREAVLASMAQPTPDLWPVFDALAGLPLALIRGVNSDLLSKETADEMSRRRPDMIRADVPDRGHVPFLDEPEALVALNKWLEAMR